MTTRQWKQYLFLKLLSRQSICYWNAGCESLKTVILFLCLHWGTDPLSLSEEESLHCTARAMSKYVHIYCSLRITFNLCNGCLGHGLSCFQIFFLEKYRVKSLLLSTTLRTCSKHSSWSWDDKKLFDILIFQEIVTTAIQRRMFPSLSLFRRYLKSISYISHFEAEWNLRRTFSLGFIFNFACACVHVKGPILS